MHRVTFPHKVTGRLNGRRQQRERLATRTHFSRMMFFPTFIIEHDHTLSEFFWAKQR
jgi:hypothetical protein